MSAILRWQAARLKRAGGGYYGLLLSQARVRRALTEKILCWAVRVKAALNRLWRPTGETARLL